MKTYSLWCGLPALGWGNLFCSKISIRAYLKAMVIFKDANLL